MENTAPEISTKGRLIPLCVAWFAAFAASSGGILTNLEGVLYTLLLFFFFPAGLLRLFISPFISPQNDPPRFVAFGALIFAWLAYAAITILTFRSKIKRRYIILYSILCALLVLNLIGCHKLSKDPLMH